MHRATDMRYVVSWHDGAMVSFDTETTGTDPLEARIVTVCLARCQAHATPEVRSWLVDPGVEIPAEAAAVHGITTEVARRDGEPPAGVLEAVAEVLVSTWLAGLPTVAMNAAYDLTVIESELDRHGLDSLGERLDGAPMLVVDPLVIDRHVDRYRPGKKRLADLCEVYNVLLQGAHTADGDALAAARVAWRMARRFPDELGGDLRRLQDLQAAWHREWAEHFEPWLRDNVDPQAVIEREWPLRRNPVG
jgi:DNA polymerase III subunit epsilon